MMQANSIEEVIEFLDQIIQKAIVEEDPVGYFPALYRKVTISVKEAIEKKEFENNERMEKLDVLFANRYLFAYSEFIENGSTTECWKYAFEETSKYWPIVLQHLLLGMNAHINLDLGIAAARISPGDKIDGLKNDFNKINKILSNLVKDVEEELSEIWPTLLKILKWTKNIDDFIVNFSMEAARNAAWSFACHLAPLSIENQKILIDEKDLTITKIAEHVIHPGFLVSSAFMIIRLGERGSIAKRIEKLM